MIEAWYSSKLHNWILQKILQGWICGQIYKPSVVIFYMYAHLFPSFRRQEHTIRKPTQDTVTSDDYYMISKMKKYISI